MAKRLEDGIETLPCEVVEFLETVQAVVSKTMFGIETFSVNLNFNMEPTLISETSVCSLAYVIRQVLMKIL